MIDFPNWPKKHVKHSKSNLESTITCGSQMSTQTSYVMVSKYISEDRSPEEAAASRRLEPSSQITRTAVMVGPLET